MNEQKRKTLEEEQKFKNHLQEELNKNANYNQKNIIENIIDLGEISFPDPESGKIKTEKLYIVKRNCIEINGYGEIERKDIYNYYLGNECIGGFIDPNMPAFNENIPEKRIENIKHIIENTNTEELKDKSLKDLEQEQLQEIALALGISAEEIKEIEEADLDQEVQEDENQVTLSENETKSLNTREETNLSQYIKGETLENKLGLKEKGIEDGVKLARVSTSSVSSKEGMSKSTIDSFVVIRKNGEAVVLGEDILKPNPQTGLDPTNKDVTIDNNGKVDEEVNTTSFLIVNGNGKEYLNIGYDENSGKEIKYSMWSDAKGKYLNTELETNRTWIQDEDVREFMYQKGNGIYEADEMLEKNDEHGECEKKEVEDLDKDPNNDSHEHTIDEIKENDYIPNTNYTWRNFADKCGYRGEGDIEKAFLVFEEAKKQEEDKTNEEIINMIIEEKEEEYGMTREKNK